MVIVALSLLSFALVVAGVALLSVPLALVVAGVVVGAVAVAEYVEVRNDEAP